MAKFNDGARPAVRSPIVTHPTPAGLTHEGAPGYSRDRRSELFLLAVSNMVAEHTFYESAKERDSRFATLVRDTAVNDLPFLAGFLPWLRTSANMRSAPLVAALEAVHARLAAGLHGGNRALVAGVLRRPDEPGEALAYWTSKYGRNVPQPVKRGIAYAATRLYDEKALLKYDASSGEGYRFGDVLELTHPAPQAEWQAALFKHAIDRRHGRDGEPPAELEMVNLRARLMAMDVPARRALLASVDAAKVLRNAGMTWEVLAGWLQGPMDAAAWETIIPSMGIMALVRNLRNFDQAGISDEVAEQVGARISLAENVARSHMFPFRFLAAHRNAHSLRWAWPLEQALNASLANVPALPGRTLILVDRSGSMFNRMSGRSELTYADSAAVFGTALALRANDADLVQFGTTHHPVAYNPAESILTVLPRFANLGGTNTAQAVARNYRGHDRVVIVTDEQAWYGRPGANPGDQVPDRVPVYTWNLAGYEHGHGASGSGNRHTFGDLSDGAFSMIGLLESGRDGSWPFQIVTPKTTRPGVRTAAASEVAGG